MLFSSRSFNINLIFCNRLRSICNRCNFYKYIKTVVFSQWYIRKIGSGFSVHVDSIQRSISTSERNFRNHHVFIFVVVYFYSIGFRANLIINRVAKNSICRKTKELGRTFKIDIISVTAYCH